MSFAEEFQAAERRALVENTAQDVFNNLKDLVNHASLHASRWIWELLQNARDAAIPGSPLHICVCLTETEVAFQHDGMAFTTDQVAHLIHHGSTKGEGQVGRFGTGFLSTHIISKVPRVSGRLNDGKTFTFRLDRTGATAKDLTDSMNRSSKEFVESVGTASVDLANYSTRYVYPLTQGVQAVAQSGVVSLETYAPYVLAFNHEIDSIEVVRDGKNSLYKRRTGEPLKGNDSEGTGEGVTATQVQGKKVEATPVDDQSSSGKQLPSFMVATVTEEGVTVAVVAHRNGDSLDVQFGPHVPRFFMAFPLFGTEGTKGMSFPGVVNSRLFRPQKERDGLYLGQEQEEDNAANKKLVETACPLLLVLVRECAKSGWKGIDRLCKMTATEPPRGVDSQWLQPLIKTSLVEPLRADSLVPCCGSRLIASRDAWIPLGSSTVPSNSLWELLRDFADSDSKLVAESAAQSWEENIRGWASILGVVPEDMLGSFSLKDCAERLAEFGSLDRLREALRAECDPVSWCNKLFGLLIRAGQTSLFDSLSLLPNQRGVFQKRNPLRLDRGIDDELKGIGEALGLPVRSVLLHKDVVSADIHKLLSEKTQKDVLTEITSHLQTQAQKAQPVSGFRQGNVRLFAWILGNGALESLESFPALTQETPADGAPPPTFPLTKGSRPEAIPLAPPECWPEDARAFSDLFPARYVLSSEYHAKCPDAASWTTASERGFVRLDPVFETLDYVQDFVDDALPDDDTHKSKERFKRTQIAFLREKNVGLMDSARKSKAKCLSLLRFLAGYMIRNDPAWKDKFAVPCECDETHECWKAGWVVPLKKNKWIYLDKNRSEQLSVESLARFLKGDNQIVRLLSDGEGPSFLAALGVSAGDFLMRSVSSDEDSRVTLSKSLIQMFQAVGGDIKQMNDLAQEIAAHPDTIKNIQKQGEIRRKVKKNQGVGKAVEQAFQSALGSGHGLKVERAPVGSDYSVEPENDWLDDDGNEILLRVGTPADKFLIEIKATVGQHVRMTEVQGKKAKQNPNGYALCVVALSSQEEEVDEATIREKAKFVFDIGTKIKPLVEGVESLEGSRRGVVTRAGSIEVEMEDQSVKFKVGHDVWEAGISFDEAVRHLGGTSDLASVSAAGAAPSSSQE